MSLLGLVIPFILRESLFRSLSVPVILLILCKSLFRSLSVLVIPFILRESLFRSLSVHTLKSTQQTHRTLVSSLKSQISTISNHSYLVIPFTLSESLFMSLLGLVIPFILRESLFRSLSVPVILFILCKSLFRSLSVSQYKPSQVSTKPNQGHGHLVTPHTLRESLCRSLSALVTAGTLRESLQKRSKSQSRASAHTPRVTVSVTDKCHGPHTTRVTVAKMTQSVSRLLLHSHGPVSSAPVPVSHSINNKRRNNLIKQINGNGKNSLSICHWNLGSKKWKNKRNQIQALVDQTNPDIMFISEANLDDSTPSHDSLITGYLITLPKTMTRNGTARLVLLTKENLDFKIRDDLMDDIFTSIWLKIKRPGSKGLLICGLYREHQYLLQDTDWSLQPIEQIRRWSHFLRQVETARLSDICHIIGDVNLDFIKWNTPDHSQLQMITDSKNTLEASGFYQLVKEVTRSWPGQVDSLIDHFWTNEPSKVLSVTNLVRAVGDHNVITATVRNQRQ